MTTAERWVLAYEQDSGNGGRPVGVRTPISRTLVVGRQGDLPLGVDIPDPGISRTAVTIIATRNGWEVDVKNRNGAFMHCWGQAPSRIEGHTHLAWPRIGLRILNGAKPGAQAPRYHWVLLEADMIQVAPGGPQPNQDSASRTFSPTPPQPLTDKQVDALNAVFGELLQWPPRLPAQPRKLASAARVLGISESGVQARLIEVRDKAVQFGSHRSIALNDPTYLYTLVRAGFLDPPSDQMERTERTW